MFDYFGIPQSDPDPVLENTGITASTHSASLPQAHQDLTSSTQALQFPVPGIPMTFLQPEQNCSQQFDSSGHHPSSNGLLQQHTQLHNTEDHHAQHSKSESIPNTAVVHVRGFSHALEQPQRSQVPLSSANSHTLPLPLRLPLPQAQQHVPNLNHIHSSWSPHQLSLGCHTMPLPTPHPSSRQFPVGNLLYNASQALPQQDLHHLPQGTDPLPTKNGNLLCNTLSSLPSHDSHYLSQMPPSSRTVELHETRKQRTLGKRRVDSPSEVPHRSPRRRRTKRSLVWDFFDESGLNHSVAVCKLCKLPVPRGRKLAKNTTNLRKHLQYKHRKELNEYVSQRARLSGHFGHAPVQRSPAPTQIALQQSQRHQLGFSMSTPGSDQIQSASNNTYPFQSGHQALLVQTTQPYAVPFSAAIGSNDIAQPGANESNGRRSQEGSPAAPPYHAERLSASSHLMFPQSTARPTQFPACSSLPDRIEYFDPTAVERSTRGNGSDKPPVHPAAVFQRSGTAEERQHVIFPGNASPELSSDLSIGVLRLLAFMDLPLAASQSKGFEALFSAPRLQNHVPKVPKLSHGLLLNQKKAIQRKMRALLANAEKLVVVVQTRESSHNIFCRYLKHGHAYGQLCLEVLPNSSLFPGGGDEARASLVEVPPSSKNRQPIGTACINQAQKSLSSVEQALDWWDIREKVVGVLILENLLPTDTSRLVLHKRSQKQVQSTVGRDDFNSARNFCPDSTPTENQKRRETMPNGATLGSNLLDKISVLPCFAAFIETIVSQTICESNVVRRSFIDPMSRGLFKALGEKSFLDSENCQSRPANLQLPLTNLSMEELLAHLRYFSDHLEIIQGVLKRKGDAEDVEVVCMRKGDLKLLEVILDTFAEPLRQIRTKRQGDVFRSERLSIALPAMKQLLQDLEGIYHSVTEPLKTVVMDVFQAVKLQREAMESQSIYACATLLDPRFKREGFSTVEAADVAESQIAETFERERKRQDVGRGLRDSGGNATSIIDGPSMGYDQMIGSDTAERELLSSFLRAYLEEPIVEGMEDVEGYWRGRHSKWPLLAEIAAQYALMPSTCDTDTMHSVLGDYKRLDSFDSSVSCDSLYLSFCRTNMLLVDGDLMLS